MENQIDEAQIYDSNTYVKRIYVSGHHRRYESRWTDVPHRAAQQVLCIGDTDRDHEAGRKTMSRRQCLGIVDEDGEAMESAPHPKQVLWLALDAQADRYDILRMAV